MQGSLQDPKIYVYDGLEVKLTGRSAKKPLRTGREDELHEICPADKENGSWKKWVRITELYEVMQQ